jgi:putative NADH-flavin reductase
MKLAIFGATGGVGSELLEQGLEQGHELVVLVRDASKLQLRHANLSFRHGNVLNSVDVEETLENCDAAIVSLGGRRGQPRPCASGTANVISAMQKFNQRRLVVVTSVGTGDSRGKAGFFFGKVIIPLLLREEFADKEAQEKLVKESGLEWTIVRPSGLTDNAARHAYKADPDLRLGQKGLQERIARADVAHFCLAQLADTAWLGAAVSISD